jgi:hypothetical protein
MLPCYLVNSWVYYEIMRKKTARYRHSLEDNLSQDTQLAHVPPRTNNIITAFVPRQNNFAHTTPAPSSTEVNAPTAMSDFNMTEEQSSVSSSSGVSPPSELPTPIVDMQDNEGSQPDHIQNASPKTVEPNKMFGAYQQKWMDDEDQELRALEQLKVAVSPHATTRGFSTKQGWRSLNKPSPPYTQDPPTEVDMSPAEYVNLVDDDDDLEDKYFDPDYYATRQTSYELDQVSDSATS